MTQELIIEGNKVDMPNDPITLQFKSNLFGHLDTITSSNSLTIQLPKTPRNNFVFQFADIPQSSGFQRRWYDATFKRDGIPIISGRVALLSTTREHYEVCLVWGLIQWLEDALTNETTLRDLPIGYQAVLRKYDINVFTTVSDINYGYLYYDNGGAEYAIPVVNVGWIFSLIINLIFSNNIDTTSVDLTQLRKYYFTITDDLVGDLVTPANLEPSFLLRDFLPEIKVIDFFKAVCHIMGWYIELSPTGTVRIESINTIGNTANAVDWSDKLASDIPDSVSFDFNSMAQRNWFRYEKDENVTVNADYYFEVNDTTLKRETTTFELPFAPTDYANLIIQYETVLDNNGDSETKFVETTTRILKVLDDGPLNSNGDPIPYLSFEQELYFRVIIANKYNAYTNIMREPKVVTVQLRLADYDLINLDYTIPVYISRYGSYFAIIELQAQGEYTTAKLLKLS